ncbi:hypothetical protein [Nonomuraea sp. NPDC049784]|uniref:hypothetical protein n=1 Tax=Nonomuraea sp. NPDC049784 TaxID=3154361 RepID=UPI0033F008DF
MCRSGPTSCVHRERHLTRFRDWCARRADCALHGTDAGKARDELVAGLRRPPPSASAGRPVLAGCAALVVAGAAAAFCVRDVRHLDVGAHSAATSANT